MRHAGEFRELEDQMLNFSTAGYLGDRSPDRVDALVWARNKGIPPGCEMLSESA